MIFEYPSDLYIHSIMENYSSHSFEKSCGSVLSMKLIGKSLRIDSCTITHPFPILGMEIYILRIKIA